METAPAPVKAISGLPPNLTQLGKLVKPVSWATEKVLPVRPQIEALLPDKGLRQGSTISVVGATSLALAMVATASAKGSWCAAVGFPDLGLVAAAGMGVELSRFVLVPHPGEQFPVVAAALIDAFDAVILAPSPALRQSDARRLSAHARERGAVLMCCEDQITSWPQPDLRVRCERINWNHLGRGHGVLSRQSLQISVEGKGAASRAVHASITALAS